MKFKNVAIIPARGGSKRLFNKNILNLNTFPLISYSINFAIANRDIISEVYVSTDDEMIKTLALGLGVKVIDRPKELSRDTSTTVSALKHVLETLEEKCETVILLQPTNPLRPKDLLKNAFNAFSKNNYDSLVTVSLNEKKLGKIKNGKFEPFTYKMGQRSQDLEPLYFENGLLYISKASLINDNKILGSNNMPYIVNHPYASVDIDTEEDLKYAEFVINNYPNV